MVESKAGWIMAGAVMAMFGGLTTYLLVGVEGRGRYAVSAVGTASLMSQTDTRTGMTRLCNPEKLRRDDAAFDRYELPVAIICGPWGAQP